MFQLAYIYAQMRKGAVPDIWLQYPHYFEEFADDVRTMYGANIRVSDNVSIHVRRGDYLTDKAFVSLSDTDYYERAIALFPAQTKFLVFSDDTEWCKRKWPHFTVIEGQTDIKDLNQMAGCRGGNIIANSSFSWWAAYLNPHREAPVIYPKRWHTDGVQRVGFLKEWREL
jgi:hypothetical protein